MERNSGKTISSLVSIPLSEKKQQLLDHGSFLSSSSVLLLVKKNMPERKREKKEKTEKKKSRISREKKSFDQVPVSKENIPTVLHSFAGVFDLEDATVRRVGRYRHVILEIGQEEIRVH